MLSQLFFDQNLLILTENFSRGLKILRNLFAINHQIFQNFQNILPSNFGLQKKKRKENPDRPTNPT